MGAKNKLISSFMIGIRFYMRMPFDTAILHQEINPTEIITEMDKDRSWGWQIQHYLQS